MCCDVELNDGFFDERREERKSRTVTWNNNFIRLVISLSGGGGGDCRSYFHFHVKVYESPSLCAETRRLRDLYQCA
jgi:hypothetical protein